MTATDQFNPDYSYIGQSSITYSMDCDEAPESCKLKPLFSRARKLTVKRSECLLV